MSDVTNGGRQHFGEPVAINKRLAAFANYGFSLGGVVFNIVSGLLFVPIYLRQIDDATYGVWLAAGGLVGMLGLFESGLSTVYILKLTTALDSKDHARMARLTGAGLITASMVGLFIVVSGGTVAWFTPIIFECPAHQVPSLRLAVALSSLGSGLIMPAHILSAIPQALQRTILPGTIILFAMASGLATILFGLQMDWGVVALGCGPVSFGLVMLCGNALNDFGLWREFKLPRLVAKSSTVKELWRDARVLLLARTSTSIATNLQSPAAAFIVSAEASTVIGLTGRLVSLVPLLVDRLGSAAFAGVAHVAQRPVAQRESVLREIITVTTVVSGIGIGLAFCFTKPVMRLWVGEQRYAGDLVLCLLLAASFLAMRQVAYSNLLSALGQIRPAAGWLAADAVLRVLFILLIAPFAGLPGIPGASVLAGGIVVAGLSRLMASIGNIPLKSTLHMGGIGFFLSLSAGFTWRLLMPVPQSWPNVGLQVSICATCILMLVTSCDHAWRRALKHNLNAVYQLLKGSFRSQAQGEF